MILVSVWHEPWLHRLRGPSGPPSFRIMKYVRLYTDESGASRLEHRELSFESRDFAPPAPPLEVSDPEPATAVMVMRGVAGWSDAAHPAPARQWMYCLNGRWELEASGESVTIGAGGALLLEDTTGPGHASRCVEDSLVAVVRIRIPLAHRHESHVSSPGASPRRAR